MKETLIILGIFLGALFMFGTVFSQVESKTELMCRQDCEKMSATYAHHDMGSNGQTDRCSCSKDGEIKPIW